MNEDMGRAEDNMAEMTMFQGWKTFVIGGAWIHYLIYLSWYTCSLRTKITCYNGHQPSLNGDETVRKKKEFSLLSALFIVNKEGSQELFISFFYTGNVKFEWILPNFCEIIYLPKTIFSFKNTITKHRSTNTTVDTKIC